MKRTEPIATLPDYLKEVLRISRGFGSSPSDIESEGPWFRGVNDRRHRLTPGSYWRKDVDEEGLVVDFLAEAPPYIDSSRSSIPETLWDWYFLMQHYGLPTRLLDWTENALVALYFALQPPGPRPCVWLLEPARLNKITIRDQHVVAPGGAFSKHWLPIASEDQESGCHLGKATAFRYQKQRCTNRRPMAIFAARRNARIIAQQGVFTVHGSSPEPLEALLGDRPDALAYIDIKREARATLLKQLEICGVSEMRLFPELDKLAPALKRRFGLGR
jgi:hypothetical protein